MILLDNLDAQTYGPNTKKLRDMGTGSFLYPGGETNELAPVDAGYGKDVKHEVGIELHNWLDSDENLLKWESGPRNGGLSAKDRRVLLTCWVSAEKKRAGLKYYSLWRYFEKTGGLITTEGTDGTDDDKTQPTKMPEGEEHSFVSPTAEANEIEEAAKLAAHTCAKREKRAFAKSK